MRGPQGDIDARLISSMPRKITVRSARTCSRGERSWPGQRYAA